MADPVSLASGLLALVIFTHKSCVTLYTTIQGIKSHPKQVRDLVEELTTLNGVLESLADTLKSDTNVDLSALDLPITRCGNACKEFLQELQKCCSRSGGDKKSFRDWAKLKYMGDNIDEFKNSLAAYKSTIIIALTDLQVRNSSVTLESLKGYKDLIETATDDLEARLESIDEKLETLMARTATKSEITELQRIKDERSSTQKCLLICARFSELISELQPTLTDNTRDAGSMPENITSDGIRECKISIEQTTAKLERHMQDIMDRMTSQSSATMAQEDANYFARLREEWTTARQCRDICTKADQHLKDNISIIDNHATGDEAVQFLVSHNQKTIHGKNRGYGDKIQQLGGHLSDESIQKVSGDFLQMVVHRSEIKNSSTRNDAPSKDNDANEERTNWRPQYGSGRTMKHERGPNASVNPELSHRAGSDKS